MDSTLPAAKCARHINGNADGLARGSTQDARAGEARMLGYLDIESLALTIETELARCFSRSRQRLCKTSESSGHALELAEARLDYDGATLLLRACGVPLKAVWDAPVTRAQLPHARA